MDLIPAGDTLLSTTSLGHDHDGPALVMIHGLMFGNLATWYSPIAAPLSRKHHVLLYDQRGHGASPATPCGYDLNTQAQDLAAVLAHHGYADQPVDVVGHSMGSLIALHFALLHPGRVRKLVLVDPPYPVGRYVLPELTSVTSAETLSRYIDAHADLQAGRRLSRVRRRLLSLLFETTLVRDMQAIQPMDDAALRALHCPVLIVVGDRSYCANGGYDLQQRLPRAQLAHIDCGHYIPEESPAVLCQLIADFCEPEA